MAQKKVTIQEVARLAGVSPMTVSHVINDHPHVRDSTRQRVLDAIGALGYRVNIAARNLRAGRTRTIGLAVPEVHRPYYGQLGAHIIDEAARWGFGVVMEQTSARRQSELDAILMSRNRMYDGLILATVGLSQTDADLLSVDYPVVILGERIFDGPVDHVAMANVEGARALVAHLIDQGCRRIAVIAGDDLEATNVSTLRLTGYKQALAAAGIPYDESLRVVIHEFSMPTGARAAGELMAQNEGIDAIFAVTDTIAIGVLRGLADLGVRVPEDVRVAGFDNILEGEFTVPRLTTIDPDHRLMARKSVQMLVERIDGQRQPPREFSSPYALIARESTVIVPGQRRPH